MSRTCRVTNFRQEEHEGHEGEFLDRINGIEGKGIRHENMKLMRDMKGRNYLITP
jgi:hypothetical protein